MSTKISEITEKTLLPLSLVITLVGGVLWLASMHASLAETSHRIETLEHKQETIERIDRRLARIEGKLGIDGDR